MTVTRRLTYTNHDAFGDIHRKLKTRFGTLHFRHSRGRDITEPEHRYIVALERNGNHAMAELVTDDASAGVRTRELKLGRAKVKDREALIAELRGAQVC